MAHFAKVEDGIVTQVIVADQDFIDNHCTGTWIQTSYNTRFGVHYQPNSNTPSEDQSLALRGNFAGEGYIYDASNDVFYLPRPRDENGEFASWTLNTKTWDWEPPIPFPEYEEDQYFGWSESLYQSDNTKGWVDITE